VLISALSVQQLCEGGSHIVWTLSDNRPLASHLPCTKRKYVRSGKYSRKNVMTLDSQNPCPTFPNERTRSALLDIQNIPWPVQALGKYTFNRRFPYISWLLSFQCLWFY
jgi:hypothetical protein